MDEERRIRVRAGQADKENVRKIRENVRVDSVTTTMLSTEKYASLILRETLPKPQTYYFLFNYPPSHHLSFSQPAVTPYTTLNLREISHQCQLKSTLKSLLNCYYPSLYAS